MTHFRLTAAALAASLLLAACGSDSSDEAPPTSSTPPPVQQPLTALTGTVAVGAPITDGTLRVVDATGATVAEGIVVQADGTYTVPVLTGTAPFRIEACGQAGENFRCLHSVAQGAGVANVTPLTTATVLLATGESPEALMTGADTALSADAVAGAQTQLRTGLASVLAAGGVSASFDFVSGALDAGSRTGYDKVLDSIAVNTGLDDATPFVQISPRLGTGNLYLEQQVSVGTLTSDSGASTLALGGLETLFQRMSSAVASASACVHPTDGLAAQMAATARIGGEDGDDVNGKDAVAAALCGMFEEEEMFGSTLLSPTLGRCDLSGAQPVCRVSFVLRSPDGAVQPVGQGMSVVQETGGWKFAGDADPVAIQASAKVQRDVRIDGDTSATSYSRALAFEIPAITGVACARVSQRTAEGGDVTLAYYKRFATGTVRRLSLWTQDGMGTGRGMDPLVGALRSADDSWVHLPDGAEGDEVVRRFFRGGRSVTVALFSDAACSAPVAVANQSLTSFDVDVQGVPPVWAALPSLPWPELTEASRQALLALTVPAGSTTDFTASWTFPRGTVGLNGATFCTDRARCGQDDIGRIGDKRVSAMATGVSMPLTTGEAAVAAGSYKMLALYGRTGDGVDMQSNAIACPPGTVECH